jgi:hypothetical protein
MAPDNLISAGEIRSWGVVVPDDIPDCATVPRSAMHFGTVACTAGGEPTEISAQCEVTFTEPFRWIHGVYEVQQ